MQAECLRSQIAPLAARYRSCSSNRQRTSAAQCLGSQFAARGRAGQFAPLAARYRSCSSNRQRTSAAQCLGCQIAPPGSSLSLVLIEPPTHVRGPVPGLSNRAPGSSPPLVLIKPPAHTRGPVPGLSIRAPGSSLSLVLIEPPAHVRGGCTPGNSRCVAARDNSRPGAVSYAHACANRQRTCAPGVVHGTFSVPAPYILQGPP